MNVSQDYQAAALEAALQPLDALGGRAVRERLWHHPALRLTLQAVVANRSRGAKALFRIARLNQIVSRRVMAPYPRIAVGLQLLPD